MQPHPLPKTAILLGALFQLPAYCLAAESATGAAWGGGVAQSEAIFSVSWGSVLTDSANQLELTATPGRSAPLAIYDPLEMVQSEENPALKPAAPLPLAQASPNIQNTNPQPAQAEPLARGELGAPSAAALTDNLPRNLALSLGTVFLSASLDHAGDKFAVKHGNNSGVKAVTDIGNALPFVAIGFAGLVALGSSDPRLSQTGFAALQAGGASAISSFGLKYVFARARPEANLGSTEFHNSVTTKGDSSLPSIHAATVWGVITPFAKEYDQPWLYGLAALTNFARVADRKHWVSDTVAGSLIGYWLGDIAWQHGKPKADKNMQVYVGNKNVTFSWLF